MATTDTQSAKTGSTSLAGAGYDFAPVAFDLYRDIHKGVRSELFAITSTAGSVDPADAIGRLALADHVSSVGEALEAHALHEDTVIEPVLFEHMPELAEQAHHDHEVLDTGFAGLVRLAQDAAEAGAADQRRLGHLLYLELSAFTSSYLTHQILEERVIMPALEQALGVDAVIGLHVAIISSIPPDEMARSLSFMLPAMNLDDRADLLGGFRATAPPEAFADVMNLAGSVLAPADHTALENRLRLA